VVEEGTHTELYEDSNSLYHSLVKLPEGAMDEQDMLTAVEREAAADSDKDDDFSLELPAPPVASKSASHHCTHVMHATAGFQMTAALHLRIRAASAVRPASRPRWPWWPIWPRWARWPRTKVRGMRMLWCGRTALRMQLGSSGARAQVHTLRVVPLPWPCRGRRNERGVPPGAGGCSELLLQRRVGF
jgi:hypothetical protein